MWFRMIVRSGTALANSASSGSWGEYIQASSDIPIRDRTLAPALKSSLASWPCILWAAVNVISG